MSPFILLLAYVVMIGSGLYAGYKLGSRRPPLELASPAHPDNPYRKMAEELVPDLASFYVTPRLEGLLGLDPRTCEIHCRIALNDHRSKVRLSVLPCAHLGHYDENPRPWAIRGEFPDRGSAVGALAWSLQEIDKELGEKSPQYHAILNLRNEAS